MPKDIDLRPVRQIAAHELAVDQIRRALDLGRFRPGEHLPSERDLSDMLELSRTTVRAAVAVLEHEGRISVRRGRGGGFLVLEPEYDPAAARRDLRRNRVALRDAFDYRVVVETGAARLAAERRRVSDLAPLSHLVERMGETLRSSTKERSASHVAEFKMLDSSFHLGIAQASGNEHLVESVAQARSRMYLPVSAIFSQLTENANDLHLEILNAVRDKDPDAAADLMAAHINETRVTLEAILKRQL